MTELDVVPTWQTISNGIGVATWAMALSDSKCKREYLEYGQYVVIEDGPFIWKGIIDTPRGWGGKKVFVTAYELNTVLDSTDTPVGLKLTGNAGFLFDKLCGYVSNFGMATITMENVFRGGISRDETLGQSPLEHIRQIAGRAGCFFWIDGDVVNGSFQLSGNFVEKRGELKPRVLRAENLEFGDEQILVEQGKIVNVFVGVGDASTDGKRVTTPPQVDNESIGKYRRRRANQVFSGNKEMSTLMKNTLQALAYSKQARIVTNFKALNVNDLFNDIGLNNQMTLDVPDAAFNDDGSFDFRGQIEIMGFGKTYGNEKVELVCSEAVEL